MEQLITHACGHGQIHYLAGFASQQERKARWLQTTQCRACFIAAKRSDEMAAMDSNLATIADLDLAALVGSDRQIAWATTIRAQRLADTIADIGITPFAGHQGCLRIADAKWWIDHRDLADGALLETAELHVSLPAKPVSEASTDISRAA